MSSLQCASSFRRPCMSPIASRSRLPLVLLLAAAGLLAPSALAVQLRPLGDEVAADTGPEYGNCPRVAGNRDGSALLLLTRGNPADLYGVAVGADGSLGNAHLVA